jgi:P-type Cu+ transporter
MRSSLRILWTEVQMPKLQETAAADKHKRTITVPIEGVSCAGCIARVESTLRSIHGVFDATANLATRQATFSYDPHQVALEQVADQLRMAGYPPVTEETRIEITGMHCSSCVLNVEQQISSIPEVVSVEINYGSGTGVVHHVGATNLQEQLTVLFSGSGYQITVLASSTPSADPLARELAEIKRPLIFSLFAAIITMSLMAIEHFHIAHLDMTLSGYLQAALATVVYFWGGLRFHRGLWHSIRRRSADMNTLVSLGTSAAYWFSVAALFFPSFFQHGDKMPEYYFDSAIMIIALILLGRFLETKARSRSSAAITKLLKARPETATLINSGQEQTVPSVSLVPGDIVRVRPGERIAADGKIIRGSTAIDESMLTGESLPVDKTIGDDVTGGTINASGSIDFEVTTAQGDSRLSKIANMVTAALSTKPAIQKLADKVASVFVPIILALALLTLVVWLATGAEFAFALKSLIAILIIACPCALGLATPMAVMVGVGKAASLGILFKSGETFEQIAKLKVLFFDKTGTLTYGHFAVTSVETFGADESSLLRLAAGLESRSEHPLAKAVVTYAASKRVTIPDCDDFTALAGAGASGTVDGKVILLGTYKLMLARKVDTSAIETRHTQANDQGSTRILVAVDGRVQGFFALSDQIKPEAKDVIAQIKAFGITPAMITGDSKAAALRVGHEIGIEKIEAELLPQQKLMVIKNQNRDGATVGMVGDGINDAPALAAADVGIALSSGTEIAVESAAVTLTGHSIERVPTAIRLAKATLRNIKQNLFWAFFYNVAAIPIAAGVLYPIYQIQLSPAIAAAAMSFSSLFVVTNALRLRRFR